MRPTRLPARVVSLAAAVALVLGASGCGSTTSSADRPSSTSSTLLPDSEVANLKQPVRLTIDIRGYRTIHFDDQSNFNLLRATSSGGTRLLTAGTFAPVKAGEWTIHEAFMNLVRFTGDGTYTIKARTQGTGTQQMVDNAYAVLSRATATNPAADAGRFDVAIEPCRATVKGKGSTGSLRCPALADDRGNVISLAMTWKANGTPTDLLAQVTSTTAP